MLQYVPDSGTGAGRAARADSSETHRPAAARRTLPHIAHVIALQGKVGNRATAAWLAGARRLEPAGPATGRSPAPSALQRCGGGGCSCGGVCGGGTSAEGRDDEPAPVFQRTVDPALGQAIDGGRFPGSAAAHPPLRDAVQIFDGLSPGDKRDTVRALNPGQQLAWVRHCLTRNDDSTWRVLMECVSTEARAFAVRSLMASRRMNESQAPRGAYGILNGLSDGDQLTVLNQLSEPERRVLQQGLAGAPIDRLRLERQLAAVDPEAVPSVREVSFPLTWVADELPQRAATGLAPAAYMAGQGAHAVGATNAASGLRMVGTRYWRAFVPANRALELQRVLNQLPQDLTPHLDTHLANTVPGQAPRFPWVSRNVGAMDRPFTVAELQSIPSLVRRFNTAPGSLGTAELTLLSRVASLHVGGAHAGGSPLMSWSVPPRPGQADPVTWANQRRFKVRADFDPATVLDNTRATAANTLSPADANAGFEPPLNAEEAEYLATAQSEARILTVEPLSGAVRGELVPGSARWMARNATQLRWAGRGLLVVSFAMSGWRIANAGEAQRARVIGEEAGAQLLGWGGAVLTGAGCVALGVATGGVGLLLCGMAGGLLGGMAGAAAGGAMTDALGRPVAPDDPFGLTPPAGGGPGQNDGIGQAPDADSRPGPDWLMSTAQPEILIY